MSPDQGLPAMSAPPPENLPERSELRADLKLISDMIEKGSRVLDIGCEDGALLEYLFREKQVTGRGIELSQAGVNACVARGLSVIQGNADTDLGNYPDDAFDYAVLSQTLQAVHAPHLVLEQLARIGRKTIVSFPNFGYWKVRRRLLLQGRMPVTRVLPAQWYETPNIHLCTIRDFLLLCEDLNVEVERSLILDERGRMTTARSLWWANLIGQQAIFLLRRKS
ncbi:methionine biosynthesis protein MetW [Denitrobaculum tricleocarpae]|uniref:Methionine biosynthesis protein MetW n=2 Tax=Denitrobaculum tricleocarpae TaxID=2591009 RepID=A0A545U1N5_9PROT|nr:methionine biosynthesis protein MetW [Denitrobaculum tricleocarpae]